MNVEIDASTEMKMIDLAITNRGKKQSVDVTLVSLAQSRSMRRGAPAVLALAVAATSLGAQAADWYVRPNGAAYGSSSGRTWDNAFNGFSGIAWSSVACGDNVWLAGGSYTQSLRFSSKSCTPAAPLNVRRVLASDSIPVAAAGWNAAFDNVVTISNSSPGISLPAGRSLYIDGRVNYGIRVITPVGGGDGATAATSGDVDDIRLAHIEFAGPSCAPAGNCTAQAYGINFAPSVNKVTNLLVTRCSVHSISVALKASNWDKAVIEYTDLYDISNDGLSHEDTIYSYPSTNVTMRYNYIHNVPNDGIFFEYGGAVNFRLYGNVFYNSRFSLLTTKAPGNYGPMYIYNNVFAAPSASQYGWITTNNSTLQSGTEVANNVFYFVSNNFPNSHHNAYNYTTLNGYAWPSQEPGSFTFTGNGGMVNIAGGDAHIDVSSVLRNRGAALVSDGYLNTDLDGNTRGADGTWDVGAFEYSSGAAGVIRPPTNLIVR